MTSVITYGILGLLSIGIAAMISGILIMCGIIYANIKRSEVDIGSVLAITTLVVLFSILVYILTNLLIHIYHNGFNYSFTF